MRILPNTWYSGVQVKEEKVFRKKIEKFDRTKFQRLNFENFNLLNGPSSCTVANKICLRSEEGPTKAEKNQKGSNLVNRL